MGNAEWGMGEGATHLVEYSPLPIPHSPFGICLNRSGRSLTGG
jgi:hypothetical protein